MVALPNGHGRDNRRERVGSADFVAHVLFGASGGFLFYILTPGGPTMVASLARRAAARLRRLAGRLSHSRPDRHQSGQGLVEYALILVLIAVALIVVLSTVGIQVNNVFSNVSAGIK